GEEGVGYFGIMPAKMQIGDMGNGPHRSRSGLDGRRRQHTQAAGTGSRAQGLNRSVQGDEQSARAAADLGSADLQGFNVSGFVKQSERRAHRKPQEGERMSLLDDVQPQLAAIEILALAQREQLRRVLVVGDEQAR